MIYNRLPMMYSLDDVGRVKAHANANVLTRTDVLNTVHGRTIPVGDDPNFVCVIGDFRVVYSIEIQEIGTVHHISISSNTVAKPEDQQYFNNSIRRIASAFGLTCPEFVYWWVEDYIDDNNVTRHAMNYILQDTLSR